MEFILALMEKLKPKFWDHTDSGMQMTRHMFNFRRIWVHAVIWISLVAILPLIALALANYNVIRQPLDSEILLRSSRLVSNTRRTISFFLHARLAALDFILLDNTFNTLNSPDRLPRIFKDLKKSFGDFADIGVVDTSGRLHAYAGPHNLVGTDYSTREWFQVVRDQGVYAGGVFKGDRNAPHMVLAVRSGHEGKGFHVLRATLDVEHITSLLSDLQEAGQGDAFLVSREGILQTPSLYYGDVLERIPLAVPGYDTRTHVTEASAPDGRDLIVGYSHIDQSPFILMFVKRKADLLAPWYIARKELLGFWGVSLVLIMVVILSIATYLVNRIFLADQKRVTILHDIEYSNKMVSVGRLAAGVAHEINNPLAIINEKAGLIKDLILPNPDLPVHPKLIGLINDVIASVDRCAAITRRLLKVARHVDISVESIDLKELVGDVLGFLGKDADYRSIEISIFTEDHVPAIESDRGKLQQVFLNLFNNAFAAMDDGGRLEIGIKGDDDNVEITVADNGCGISEKDLKRIFEPFFSTKTKLGGTGLGLSITYGLVQELGGSIAVSSRVGQGTKFAVSLPVALTVQKNGKQ